MEEQIVFASTVLGITIEEAAVRFRNFKEPDWVRLMFWYTTGLDVE